MSNPTNIKPEVGQKWKRGELVAAILYADERSVFYETQSLSARYVNLRQGVLEILQGSLASASIKMFLDKYTLTHLADGTEIEKQVEFTGYRHTGEYRHVLPDEIYQDGSVIPEQWGDSYPTAGRYWILEPQPQPEPQPKFN